MHRLIRQEIATDCVAYTRHDADRSIIDKWSKEQLAFCIDDLCREIKIAGNALRAALSTAKGRALIAEISQYAEMKGEAWRVGEGAEIMDALASVQSKPKEKK